MDGIVWYSVGIDLSIDLSIGLSNGLDIGLGLAWLLCFPSGLFDHHHFLQYLFSTNFKVRACR